MSGREGWTPVGPGYVIPSGQPRAKGRTVPRPGQATWMEYEPSLPLIVGDDDECEWFVDSSWRPPLDLPTEPTWGIAIERAGAASSVPRVGHWHTDRRFDDHLRFRDDQPLQSRLTFADRILDFIPLTFEQVARIEAAR